MITVYLVQHGIAVDKELDEQRPLSDAGSAEVQKVAQQLKNSAIVINKIVHSGKLRAAQTAEIFAETLMVDNVTELSGIKPNDDPQKMISQMTEDALMVVGHLPNIENVMAALLQADKNTTPVKFQNAAVACVTIDKNETYLKWFITPDLCS